MSVNLLEVWTQFWNTPGDPAALAAFRIVFGAILVVDALLHFADAKYLLDPKSFFPADEYRKGGFRGGASVFRVLPPTEVSVRLVLLAYLAAAACLSAGLMTNVSAACVFVCVSSIHNRNKLVLHSGDTVIRLLAFYLVFSKAGGAYSIDHEARLWEAAGAPWAQRLMQLQMAFLYLYTFLWKLKGTTWRSGEAVYYALNLLTHRSRALPGPLQSPTLLRAATYAVLLSELALATLVWIPATRYPVLALGAVFHLSLAFFMRMHLFQFTMVAALILFVDPSHIRIVVNNLAGLLN